MHKKAKKSNTQDAQLAKQLHTLSKSRNKKERFIRTRMWVSTFMSKFFNDRGVIPDNLGNNVLITNNMVITKNSLTAMLQVREMSEYTWTFWTSDMLKEVKEKVPGLTIDITIKATKYQPDTMASGIKSREQVWDRTLSNPTTPEKMARRAARCKYSLDVARTKVRMDKGRVYIKLRAKDNFTLKKGIQETSAYLNRMGASFTRIQSNMEEHLNYVSMLSSIRPQHLKDFPGVIFTMDTLAESLPSIQGMNGNTGTLLGYDTLSCYPYMVDFRSTANAKNIMIEALSGFGKTFIVEFWLLPFWADDYNLCIMDIKGTEFTGITKALGGRILSLKDSAYQYVNTFRWNPDAVSDGGYAAHAAQCLDLTKEWLMILCDLDPEKVSIGEVLLEEFLNTLYKSVGAISTNPNTWSRTEQLTPEIVFEYFRRYLSHEILDKYSTVASTMLNRLQMFLSPEGSFHHLFSVAYDINELLTTRCLTFDFGVLDTAANQNPVVFKYHLFCMSYINDAYVAYKKSKGEWTLKVLEESQIVNDYMLKLYAREITLRRAQNQVTILLGNSVAALADNPLSKPILENINIMVLGGLNKSSRRYLTEEYGLSELHEDLLKDLHESSTSIHRFLLINRMEKNATTAVIQARVPEAVRDSELFKVVDTE